MSKSGGWIRGGLKHTNSTYNSKCLWLPVYWSSSPVLHHRWDCWSGFNFSLFSLLAFSCSSSCLFQIMTYSVSKILIILMLIFSKVPHRNFGPLLIKREGWLWICSLLLLSLCLCSAGFSGLQANGDSSCQLLQSISHYLTTWNVCKVSTSQRMTC